MSWENWRPAIGQEETIHTQDEARLLPDPAQPSATAVLATGWPGEPHGIVSRIDDVIARIASPEHDLDAEFECERRIRGMRTRWTRLLGCVAFGLTLDATGVLAQTRYDELKSLRGLPGVAVVIQGLPDRAADPLVVTTTGEIRADVEAQLAQAGIRVMTRAEADATPSRPFLQLDFAFVRPPADLDFYVVQVTVRQWAVLTSGEGMSLRTFEDWAAEWTPRADRKTRLRAAVKEAVSRLVNAWGLANRK